MPTTYEMADDEVKGLLRRAMTTWHPNLAEAGVRVLVVMASNPDGPAVRGSGYPALAKVKVIPLKDRVSKNHDAEILIDDGEWRTLRPGQQLAALDHELRHLELIPLPPKALKAARSENSAAPWWKADDLGRPRLKTVPGDFHAGDGFDDVIGRHGDDAIEYENIRRAKVRADAARTKAA